jgi:lysozyme
MTASDKSLNIIKQFEGLSLKAYLCPAGIATIGYGSCRWPDGIKVQMGQVITMEQADLLLKFEVIRISERIPALPINQNQFDALVSFTYNVGIGNLLSSTLLKILKKDSNDPAIRNEFMKWVKITVNGQKKTLNGLVKRRTAEADLYYSK